VSQHISATGILTRDKVEDMAMLFRLLQQKDIKRSLSYSFRRVLNESAVYQINE
jgi:hypothetical protein